MNTQCIEMSAGTRLAVALVLLASACANEVAVDSKEAARAKLMATREGGLFFNLDADALGASDGRDGLVDKADSDKVAPFQLSEQSLADLYGITTAGRTIVLADSSFIESSDTHMCFLSGVIGDLYFEHYVKLWHDDANHRWLLHPRAPRGNSLRGEAICVPWHSFSGDEDAVLFVSDPPTTASTGSGSCLSRSKEVTVAPDNLGLGFLTEVYGQFEGGGEYVSTFHSTTAPFPLKLRAKNETCGTVRGGAREILVGPLDRGTIRTGVYSVSSGGTRRVRMLTTRDGVCFLTRVSGNMDGAEEKVRIFPEFAVDGNEYWVLEAAAGGGSASGNAQCLFYDQRRVAGPVLQ